MDPKLHKAVTNCFKLGLQVAQRSRTTAEGLFEFFEVPTENLYTVSIRSKTGEAHKAKSVLVKGGVAPRDAEIQAGVAKVHAWNGAISVLHIELGKMVLAPQVEGAPPTSAQLAFAKVKEYISKYEKLGVVVVGREIRYFALARHSDKTFKKLSVHILPGTQSHEIWLIMRDHLLSLSNVHERLDGMPPTDLERSLQNYLVEVGASPAQAPSWD
jgi:hypothetical protein